MSKQTEEQKTVDRDYLELKFQTLKEGIDEIKNNMVDKKQCYINHEPIRFYLWVVGVCSSFGSSIITAIIIMYVKGRM